MTDSILGSTKKNLGIADDYLAFDPDITMHINTVLAALSQIGVGPATGYFITDAADTWADFLGTDPLLNQVKTYVYLRVRMLFDPPTTSFLISAMQEQIREFEWRINVQMEKTIWTDPNPVVVDPTTTI